jgi:hypothetical protein
MDIYQVNFTSWKDVQSEYRMDEAEPEQVLLAYYSYEDYSGTSLVIYRNGDNYFYNEGGHCSCNGLEEQWGPTKFESKETFLAFLKMLNPWDCKEQIKEIIEQLEK